MFKSEKGAVAEMASREEILADFQVSKMAQIKLLILSSGIMAGRQIWGVHESIHHFLPSHSFIFMFNCAYKEAFSSIYYLSQLENLLIIEKMIQISSKIWECALRNRFYVLEIF